MSISTYIGISLVIISTGATVKLLVAALAEYRKEDTLNMTNQRRTKEILNEQAKEIKRLRIKCHANEFTMRHIIIEKVDTEEKFQHLLEGAYQFAEHHDRLR